MTKDEALKMALEAFEQINTNSVSREHAQLLSEEAITAIQEALTQPEQEPVAWLHNGKLHEVDPIDWATGTVTPLYPSAQKWVKRRD
jgi:membrane carboxypeptidase/penicillin-binding protein PbpC